MSIWSLVGGVEQAASQPSHAAGTERVESFCAGWGESSFAAGAHQMPTHTNTEPKLAMTRSMSRQNSKRGGTNG